MKDSKHIGKDDRAAGDIGFRDAQVFPKEGRTEKAKGVDGPT